MKKMSKIGILFLVLTILVSIIAGCTSSSEETAATTSTTQEGSNSASVETQKELEISVATDNFDTFNLENDDFAKLIKEKFALTIKPVVFADDEAVALAAASNSLPDVFTYYALGYINNFNKWINEGIISEIPDTLVSKYSNVQNLMNSDSTSIAVKELFGKNYMIPVPLSGDTNVYKTFMNGIYFRKDWMANVGITKEPENFDEFYEMLKAFKTQDPDKNGKADTGGITFGGGWMLLDHFTNWDINVENWVNENGKWIPGFMSDKCIAPLKYFQKLYQEGLIDPEFSSIDYKQGMQKFAGNQFGAMLRNADSYWLYRVIQKEFGTANADKVPLDTVGVLKPMKADATTGPLYSENVTYTGVLFRNGLEEEKMDRYLKLHDWMRTPEATYYMLGFEGKQYSKDAEGRVISFNNPETGTPYNANVLFPSTMLLNMASGHFDRDLDVNWPSAIIRSDIKNLSNELVKARDQNMYKMNVKLMLLSTPSKDMLVAGDICANDFTNMITQKEDITKQFEEFKKRQLANGVQAAIDEINAQAQKIGLK